MDPRIEKLAHVITKYSLRLKKGDLFRIDAEIVCMPLVKAVFAEAVKIGAFPSTNTIIPDNQETFLKLASDKQLQFISPIVKYELNKLDVLLTIWGSENTRYMSGIDPAQQAKFRGYRRSLFNQSLKRISSGSLRWCGTLFPTLAEAQEADMSLSEFEDFVFRAGHLHAANPIAHWEKVSKEHNRLIKKLNRVRQIHITASGTDLKFNVAGRKWINCAGRENFPDGEVFTGPVENSAEGHITFSFPAIYLGREVDNVRLEFKKGKVIRESATKNQKYLTALLNMDAGARRVGEFAIGTNYDITSSVKNTLFDEKIGGTCHLAVGASLPESGGKNQSALHWDMVCDLRQGGEISADGRLIYKNGKFLI